MTDVFTYSGLAMVLIGTVLGLYIAIKGYKSTEWSRLKKIYVWADFQRGPISPQIRRLSRLWTVIMIVGLILIGTGMTVGIDGQINY